MALARPGPPPCRRGLAERDSPAPTRCAIRPPAFNDGAELLPEVASHRARRVTSRNCWLGTSLACTGQTVTEDLLAARGDGPANGGPSRIPGPAQAQRPQRRDRNPPPPRGARPDCPPACFRAVRGHHPRAKTLLGSRRGRPRAGPGMRRRPREVVLLVSGPSVRA